MVDKARAERGPLSDEELLTTIFLNPTALDAFNKNRKPIEWDPGARMPLLALLKELARRPRARSTFAEITAGHVQGEVVRS
jgi:hypothetical protein